MLTKADQRYIKWYLNRCLKYVQLHAQQMSFNTIDNAMFTMRKKCRVFSNKQVKGTRIDPQNPFDLQRTADAITARTVLKQNGSPMWRQIKGFARPIYKVSADRKSAHVFCAPDMVKAIQDALQLYRKPMLHLHRYSAYD